MELKKDIIKTIFREYDIRGEYETQIDEDAAYSIGLAYGTKIRSLGKNLCVVGHDNRLSGESLTKALLLGITETGVDVKYLGLVTTPMYYFACLHLGIDTGVMVTASHNPVGDNGFKIAIENYDNACGPAVKELYDIIINGEFASGAGSIEEVDIRSAYVERVLRDIRLNRRLKVVVDPANAAGATIVHDIFDKLDAEVFYINDTSDGSFPNHHPDPSIEANMEQLKRKVLEVGADVGIGLDGDADRVGIVDEKGQMIAIDTLMAIFWHDLMPKVENKTALFDVKCSKALEDEILKLGGTPYIYRTGNSYQKNKIKEMDLAFGGELSGHLFFRDRWDGFDDGIYAGIRLLEIVAGGNKPLSELYSGFNKYYSTPEIKIASTEEKKYILVERVRKYCQDNGIDAITIDGVRAKYEDGWALVRVSNTGPNVTMRFEATSEERLEELKNLYMSIIEENV
ncbi:MAG TPA: phosphomannomutase [Firmicutes bacterium]|nr:phosphomannomutase [Bacillota bacterium]